MKLKYSRISKVKNTTPRYTLPKTRIMRKFYQQSEKNVNYVQRNESKSNSRFPVKNNANENTGNQHF